MVTGYLHPLYAESLAEFGEPLELPRCKGWILKRQIPGTDYYDAMGCYPLFACQNWSRLDSDLEVITDELVTLALVADPFGDYDEDYLGRCFDVVIPFKEHFVIDLRQPIDTIASRHHRYYSRRSLRAVHVEICTDPVIYLDEWMDMYSVLIRRHALKGIKAFSEKAFARQLGVPGMVMFRASHQGVPLGEHLWYVQENTAYSHLAACNFAGYEMMAFYALHLSAIEYFRDKLHWLDLGAGAGIDGSDREDGLSRFKRGWSTGTQNSYFCGRIFNQKAYDQIIRRAGSFGAEYFPVYRKGEFN
jgi:hypothetical protein